MSWVLVDARAVILSSILSISKNPSQVDGWNLSPNEEANHGLD